VTPEELKRLKDAIAKTPDDDVENGRER
jgi:hypothetical protein